MNQRITLSSPKKAYTLVDLNKELDNLCEVGQAVKHEDGSYICFKCHAKLPAISRFIFCFRCETKNRIW